MDTKKVVKPLIAFLILAAYILAMKVLPFQEWLNPVFEYIEESEGWGALLFVGVSLLLAILFVPVSVMVTAAGRSMTGKEDVHFDSLPLFYSDFFDQGFEAIGLLDTRLDMVEDWHDGYKQGVVYYLKENHVQGVLLWNIFGKVDQARALMRGPIKPDELKGHLRLLP